MILRALAAMAQNKIKRFLTYSFIGLVGYLFIRFLCETMEGIQSLLIGVFIYVLMTINVFAIVLALHQNCFKYITDLGVLTNQSYFSYYLVYYYVSMCRNTPISRIL